jgi:hypothetical protein
MVSDMPMQRHLYPPAWEEIAKAVKDAAGWTCEECGKLCRRPGEQLDTHRRTLTVAHLDHDPGNCDRSNLRALCAPCHLRYDARMHARHATATRAKAAERSGQTTMEVIAE